MARAIVPAADMMLDTEYKVLDKGYIVFMDYMGTDEDIIQAARVTVGKTKKNTKDDEHTLRYMFRHRHTTPFEMCEIKMKVRLPIMVARQWIRHRTGSFNEYSLRYTQPLQDESGHMLIYIPEQYEKQDQSNRQGRAKVLVDKDPELIRNLLMMEYSESEGMYDNFVNQLGMSLEIARSHLPLALYTEWVWKVDLHNLLGFLTLRADSHAQMEIRVYAEKIMEFLQVWVPQTYKAFIDYRMEAMNLSRMEVAVLRSFLSRHAHLFHEIEGEEIIVKGRERDEFMAKAKRLFGL